MNSTTTTIPHKNGYKIETNNQLEALKNRVALLPTKRFIYGNKQVYDLGVWESCVGNFTIRPDGNVAISFKNDFSDSFTIQIHLAILNYSTIVDYGKTSEVIKVAKEHRYFIAIGDIFRHFAKTSGIMTEAPTHKKKGGKGQEEEEEELENDTSYVSEWVMKALKVDSSTVDVRASMGELSSFDRHEFYLWRRLLDEGYLKTLGHDFTSFCRTLVAIPFKHQEDAVEPNLYTLSSFELVKKLLDYFLFGTNPSASKWILPTREYFEEPQSIVDLLVKNSKNLSEWYDDYDYVKGILTKELRGSRKTELEEKYLPVAFSSVKKGNTYPLYALRTIYVTSWSSDDFMDLRGLVARAINVAKMNKTKHLIKKRGKFQSYETYEAYSGPVEMSFGYGPGTKWDSTRKFDVMRRELANC